MLYTSFRDRFTHFFVLTGKPAPFEIRHMDPEAKSSTNRLEFPEEQLEDLSEFIKHETQSTDIESEDEHLRSPNPAKSRSNLAANKSVLPVYVYTYKVCFLKL